MISIWWTLQAISSFQNRYMVKNAPKHGLNFQIYIPCRAHRRYENFGFREDVVDENLTESTDFIYYLFFWCLFCSFRAQNRIILRYPISFMISPFQVSRQGNLPVYLDKWTEVRIISAISKSMIILIQYSILK